MRKAPEIKWAVAWARGCYEARPPALAELVALRERE